MSKRQLRSFAPFAVCMMFVCDPLLAANDQVHVIPASELEQWWIAPPGAPNAPPHYPIEALKQGLEGCVAVAFEIHSDGSVSKERIWRSVLTNVSSKKLVQQAALLAAHQWRFVPAPANTQHEPVYTFQISTFTLTSSPLGIASADKHQAAIEAKCKMPDFVQQVQDMINATVKAKGSKP